VGGWDLYPALDRSKIHGIFDRRHVMARACHQHALRRVGGHPIPSLVHEHPDHTAYLETGSESAVSVRIGPSPSPLDVVEAHKPVLGVDDHPDRVEADRVGGWSNVLLVVQPRDGKATKADALTRAQPR